MKTPFGKCNILNIYGQPIYIKPDASDEELSTIKEKIKIELLNLDANAPEIYNEAKKQRLWDKKKKK